MGDAKKDIAPRPARRLLRLFSLTAPVDAPAKGAPDAPKGPQGWPADTSFTNH